MLLEKDIEKVVIVNRERADVYLKPGRLEKYGDAARGSSIFSGSSPNFYFTIGDLANFENNVKEIQKDIPKEERASVDNKTEHDYLGSIISWILPIVLILVLWCITAKEATATVVL